MLTPFPSPLAPPPSLQHLIGRLQEQGFSQAVAAWAAMNLTPFNGDPGRLTWGFDLEGIAQMYRCVSGKDALLGLGRGWVGGLGLSCRP